jgi:hypothetical protein
LNASREFHGNQLLRNAFAASLPVTSSRIVLILVQVDNTLKTTQEETRSNQEAGLREKWEPISLVGLVLISDRKPEIDELYEG